MIRKYGIYVLILVLGLFLGYLIFGGVSREQHPHEASVAHQEQWTCSMHPEIVKHTFGTCPLCNMDLVRTANPADHMATNQFKMSATAMALANVETMVLDNKGVSGNYIVLSGMIRPNERTNTVQAALFDGRIEALQVTNVGDYMQKGQYFGSMYSPEMYAAQDKLLTSTSYRETHPKLFAAARNTLGLWKMTDEQIDEMLRSGKPLMNFPMYSEVGGTVTEVMAKRGTYYKEGEPLFKLSDLSTVWAVFDAYESQLQQLKVGQNIQITSKAFPGKPLQAKISFIEPILNSNRRTVSVRVTLDNKDKLLKPGMFVQGEVATDGSREVLTVPKSAVLWTGKRSLVYIKSHPDEPLFEMVEVTLGMALGDGYEILEGLSLGDEIVINGTFTVDAAAQLQGKKSMTSKTIQPESKHQNGLELEQHLPAHQGTHEHTEHDFQSAKSTSNQALEHVLLAYMELKNKLVADNNHEAASSALGLIKRIESVDSGTLNSQLSRSLHLLKSSVGKIAAAHTLEEQRGYFKEVSYHILEMASQMKSFSKPLYKQYCPMADANKGASWLSFEPELKNPFYGNSMPNCCGTVTPLFP